MSALKFDNIEMVVTETGWPSKACTTSNLVRRILTGGGTPLRPKADLTVYLFALFNENKKNGPSVPTTPPPAILHISTGGNQGRETNWGSCVGEVSRVIDNFGEVYERVENSKVEELVKLEKQRMEFTKDLELKRMQFFMDFQMELAQSNQNRRIGNRNQQQQQNGEEEEE